MRLGVEEYKQKLATELDTVSRQLASERKKQQALEVYRDKVRQLNLPFCPFLLMLVEPKIFIYTLAVWTSLGPPWGGRGGGARACGIAQCGGTGPGSAVTACDAMWWGWGDAAGARGGHVQSGQLGAAEEHFRARAAEASACRRPSGSSLRFSLSYLVCSFPM
jgi:hypothetical protein